MLRPPLYSRASPFSRKSSLASRPRPAGAFQCRFPPEELQGALVCLFPHLHQWLSGGAGSDRGGSQASGEQHRRGPRCHAGGGTCWPCRGRSLHTAHVDSAQHRDRTVLLCRLNPSWVAWVTQPCACHRGFARRLRVVYGRLLRRGHCWAVAHVAAQKPAGKPWGEAR